MNKVSLKILIAKLKHIPLRSGITLPSNPENATCANSWGDFDFNILLYTYAPFTRAFPTVFRNDFTIPTTIWTHGNLTFAKRWLCSEQTIINTELKAVKDNVYPSNENRGKQYINDNFIHECVKLGKNLFRILQHLRPAIC